MVDAASPTPESRTRDGLVLVALLLIVGIVMSSGIDGEFVFDDVKHIVNNTTIEQLDLGRIWSGSRRPLVNLTLAVNFAMGGRSDVLPYHVTNIIIHLIATTACFLLVREVARMTHLAARDGVIIAGGAALLWALHPLQTQSVTYIIQRGESMMGTAYLLAMFALVRGLRVERAAPWFLASIACVAAGMLCKAVIVTAPVMVLVTDWCLRRESFTTVMRSRGIWHAGFFATWLLLLPTGVGQGVLAPPPDTTATVGFGYDGVSPIGYAITQSLVILHYLRLCIWPFPQVLDYAWPVATIADAWWAMLIVAAMLGGTIIGIMHRTIAGLIGGWFFIVLAPTSSFVPIRDLAFEHRMYLPLLSVVVFVVLGVVSAGRRVSGSTSAGRLAALCIVSLLAMALSIATWQRNRQYARPASLWEDVVQWNPSNLRGWLQLAAYRVLDEDAVGALEAYRGAIAVDPADAGVRADDELFTRAHLGYAQILDGVGQRQAAIAAYETVIGREPLQITANRRLAEIYTSLGMNDAAIERYEVVRRADPDDVMSRMQLGALLSNALSFRRAYDVYADVYRLAPNNMEALSKLASIEIQAEQYDRAEQKLLFAQRQSPDVGQIAFLLGLVYERTQRFELAVTQYERAIRLNPSLEVARQRLDALRTGGTAPGPTP